MDSGIFTAIAYNQGRRMLCPDCMKRVKTTELPSFAESTFSRKHVKIFMIPFALIVTVFVGGLIAIGVTQCPGDNCFVAIWGFTVPCGLFGMLFYPCMYWADVNTRVRGLRDEAAFKLLEPEASSSLTGVVFVKSNLASPVEQQRAMAKTAAIENQPFASKVTEKEPLLGREMPIDEGPNRGDDASRAENSTCVVCMGIGTKRSTAFVPCGHVACCHQCSKLIMAANDGQSKPVCPICRGEIDSVVELRPVVDANEVRAVAAAKHRRIVTVHPCI